MKKFVVAIVCLTVTSACFIGCNGGGGEDTPAKEIEYTPKTYDKTYANSFELEGQWGQFNATTPGEYGIGDPFVMRWNGKYYLYPSTSDNYTGVKVFESDDLINWIYKGFAVSDEDNSTRAAYAPEVVYYNGYFYMCQSRWGEGHYIYRSTSPTEGFKLISKTPSLNASDKNYGNIGLGIDGSFFVSDDGALYLMHTGQYPSALRFTQILDLNNITKETLGETQFMETCDLNHWIEGPGTFRRKDYTYLTYTGNHVWSNGYRVGYSYAKDFSGLQSFVQPTDNITIIDSNENHRGLGHSSNTNGPDLDSVYTAYHSHGLGGRRYNLDRYFASAGLVTANGVTFREVAAPSRPYKEVTNGGQLEKVGDKYILGTSEGYFTAEYNLIPSDGQKLYFGDYYITLQNGKIELYKNNAKITEKQVYIALDAISTVRVENGDGNSYIYLNGMRVITYDGASAPGEIGYAKTEGVCYTAFTNEVFGTSDFETLKNFPTEFPATDYLKGENRGFSIKNANQVKNGVRVGEKESIVHYESEGVNAVKLAAGDWVKYGVDIGANGTYSITARVGKNSAGAKLRITIGESVLECTVPDTQTSGDSVRVTLGNINLKKGLTSMKVEVVSGNLEVVSFESFEKANAPSKVSIIQFKKINGNAFIDGSRVLVAGDTNAVANAGVAFWGNPGVANFETTLTLNCNIADDGNVGIMIRSDNFSYHPDQPKTSWRGYYLQLGAKTCTLYRYDYRSHTMQSKDFASNWNKGVGAHTIKIRAVSNKISVWIDGEFFFEATDDCAFLNGYLGVYASKGTLILNKIEYQAL